MELSHVKQLSLLDINAQNHNLDLKTNTMCHKKTKDARM